MMNIQGSKHTTGRSAAVDHMCTSVRLMCVCFSPTAVFGWAAHVTSSSSRDEFRGRCSTGTQKTQFTQKMKKWQEQAAVFKNEDGDVSMYTYVLETLDLSGGVCVLLYPLPATLIYTLSTSRCIAKFQKYKGKDGEVGLLTTVVVEPWRVDELLQSHELRNRRAGCLS
ncbi:uncharacterized protein LOC125539269 isoform X1 [Triticum urartu]|uniref:uncharacterized protein LOC125539269 isoform X1 n=1 Tax=Triticum urartu TaxID=4572 RepID=UPI00204397E2|nr:uncharacterized protein LOC125539269 isoform X1 [Triticum urartu]